MYEKNVYAITRWVGRDGAEPRMGVLKPYFSDSIEYLLWVQVRRLPAQVHYIGIPDTLRFISNQMPFADDVRKYTFPSLTTLVNKNGQPVTKHPYLPTEEQQSAMDSFVDAMDLMYAGEKDEEGYVLDFENTSVYAQCATEFVKPGLIRGFLTIPQFIGQSMRFSTVRLSTISLRTHYHHLIPSLPNTLIRPVASSNARVSQSMSALMPSNPGKVFIYCKRKGAT
jgi:hypothetical protein